MIIKTLTAAAGSQAGDASFLRELLRPSPETGEIGYSLAHAEVGPGARTRPHRLRSAEVYYILEGRGLMRVGAEASEVAAGQAVYIPPGAVQHIENLGPGRLAFLCIVEPAWTATDEEVL
jgi:mannose-6-phosphate isomerase-like protein (cupin superfamily)